MIGRLVCSGCGHEVPRDEPFPFRCPRADGDDDIDHVLTRVLDPDVSDTEGAWSEVFLDSEPNPFVKFRRLFYSYQVGRSWGLSDRAYVDMVRELDEEVVRVDGRGFRVTPFVRADSLAHLLGLDGRGSLWIKDETVNVSGTHKARHLMGILLWLEMAERCGLGGLRPGSSPRLVIASCGNAALAAAVLARAAGRSLEVFVPPDAHPAILELFRHMEVAVSVCEREAVGAGDPCVVAFRRAVAGGAIPFACQGSENGLTIEGGETLGYQIVAAMMAEDRAIDRLFLQVGGGALASATIQALCQARGLGLIARLPKIHAVQTRGAYPLRVAYDRVVKRILASYRRAGALSASSTEGPDSLAIDDERAQLIATSVPTKIVEQELQYAARHRSLFMRPWPTTPRSLAAGILDDEAYDWLAVVRGMLTTRGFPVVVSEDRLREAHAASRGHTTIAVDPTGSAGLAGALELAANQVLKPEEAVTVLFTGVER